MAHMSFGNMRVLIVDDQRPFLILLRGVVNNLGAKSVVIAQNGESAVAACRKEKFDIIISDLHLGSDKKNGFQLLEEVRIKGLIKPETVFIMVSADSERPFVLGSLEKQPDDYLIKPFSQAQLSNRLSKAYAKKMALKPVYQCLARDDVKGAIAACRELIKEGTRYRQTCTQLLAELYWRDEKYVEAEHMLSPLINHKPLPWMVVAMARTQYFMKKYNKALTLANQVLRVRKLSVEAHDVIAQCYLRLQMLEEAKNAITRALDLSPLSIDRQYLACEIAQAQNDFHGIKQYCHAIWELSKKSVHRDIGHLCSYIRSILDIAEHSEDKKERNKFKQEAALTLHRCRNDDVLSRLDEPFDYGIFETVIGARMSYLDGKLIDAKRALAESQHKLNTEFDDYPLVLAPDSIKVMNDLGEYEQASELTQKLRDSGKQLDPNIRFMLAQSESGRSQLKQSYTQFNQQGVNLYNEGKYQAAYEQFQHAQKVAPVNTGVAINLLQCLLKLFEGMEKPTLELLSSCRQAYKLVADMPLPENHQKKFDLMKDALKRYVE